MKNFHRFLFGGLTVLAIASSPTAVRFSAEYAAVRWGVSQVYDSGDRPSPEAVTIVRDVCTNAASYALGLGIAIGSFGMLFACSFLQSDKDKDAIAAAKYQLLQRALAQGDTDAVLFLEHEAKQEVERHA